MHRGRPGQTTPAFRILGLQQVPFARSRTQYFAARRDFETFGGGLLRFDPFWASHNSIQFLQKERAIYESAKLEARAIFSRFDRSLKENVAADVRRRTNL
jgi:hypothetical protein